MTDVKLSIQQRARLYPCRRAYGGCGALPGEFCVTRIGKKSYTVHLDRLEQENDAWHQDRLRSALRSDPDRNRSDGQP